MWTLDPWAKDKVEGVKEKQEWKSRLGKHENFGAAQDIPGSEKIGNGRKGPEAPREGSHVFQAGREKEVLSRQSPAAP